MNLKTTIQTTEYTEYTEFQRLATAEVLTYKVRDNIFVSDSFSVYSVYSVVSTAFSRMNELGGMLNFHVVTGGI